MPYIQIDLPQRFEPARHQKLAGTLVDIYAAIMQTQSRIVNVSFREPVTGPLRMEDGVFYPVIVVMCDIRRGRGPEQRLALAEAFATAIADELSFPRIRVVVEFTQHAGDEMFRYGKMAEDWDSAEAR